VTSVLICDERRGTRDRLYEVMAAVPTINWIDSVDNVDELVTQFGRQPADMVVIGTQRALPSGIETMRRLLVFQPQAAVIMFGSPEDGGLITAAMACGARAYLRWDVTQPEIIALLADVLSYASTFDPRCTSGTVDLSERELQVLGGMSHGHTNADIAVALTLSEETVKSHARRLYRKLDAADRAQAVAIGMRSGLLT